MKRLVVVTAIAAMALTACGGGGDDAERSSADGGPVVRIGLVGPETGPAPQFYTDLVRPAEMAVAELADEYGVTVELVTVDDQGTPDGASRAVQRVLNQENVDAIIGLPLSGSALQVAEVIQRTGRPWFTPALSPDIINADLDPNWAFRSNYNAADLATVVDSLLFADDATVGVVHSADAYGQSSADGVEAVAEANGHEVAAVEAIQPGTTDFSAGIRRLKNAGVDSVFLAITAGADTATVMKAVVQEGLAPQRVVTNATILADFQELADPAQWENLVFVDTRDLSGENWAGVTADYEAEYGEEPIVPTNTHSVWAAVDAYLRAVAEVGDGQDYDAVRQAIEGLDEVSVRDDVFATPFSATDHELYSAEDPDAWIVFGFDEAGELESRGTLADLVG